MITSQQRIWVLTIINLLIKDDIMPHIFHLDSLNEVRNALKKLYKFARTRRWFFLKNKFYKMNMQETTSMTNFLFTIKDLLGQITRVNDVIKDEDVVLIVLNVLPNSYQNFMQNVLAQRTFSTFHQLISRLLQEAQRRELRGDQTKTKKTLLLRFKNLLKK